MASTAAASLATRVPSKKRGVLGAPEAHRIGEGEGAEVFGGDVAVLDQLVGLGQGWRMSITSKCPISELKIAFSFDPNGLLRPNAVAFIDETELLPA